MDIYDEIFKMCSEHGITFYSTLPGSYNIKFIQKLGDLDGEILENTDNPLIHIPLVREESGVSLNAGAYLGGRKTAMVIQSQGIGNMITQMLSLNSHFNGSYRIPNLLIISHRGLENEKISAQKPVGSKLKEILDLVGFKHCSIKDISDLKKFQELLEEYDKGQNIAVLMEPDYSKALYRIESKKNITRNFKGNVIPLNKVQPNMTRYKAISVIINQIENEFVVSNIGHPSRELHRLKDRQRNFYLKSCLGHSYTLALGLALSTEDINQKIISFEGDGGLLMNAGSLSILAHKKPKNLIIILLDNGVLGSAGNTETYSLNEVNLSEVVQAYGFPESNIKFISKKEELTKNLRYALKNDGPFLFHVLITDEYENVPILPLSVVEIKERFMKSIEDARKSKDS
jgi:sulfopyruvate decarboxylase subunit beta